MLKADKQVTAPGLSYWKIFRLIFVIFFLYLLRDALYRWDGFKFHSTFIEFIPSVALVTICWSIVAAIVAFVVWLLIRGFEWFCLRMGWKINAELILMFIGIFVLLTLATMIGKTLLTKTLLLHTTKLIILFSIFVTSIYLAWQYRNKSEIVNESITPLVWLFGIWLMVSLPIVIYHTWIKQANNPLSQSISQPSLEDMKRPNIILVSFDSLTARDMSAYGYSRATTPFIDKWSENASVFNRFQSASNWTASASASIMTGKEVWTHRMFHGDSKLSKSKTESLPLVLKDNGYYNMAFVANAYASVTKLGISNGFDFAPRRVEFAKSNTPLGYECGFLDAIFVKLFADRIKFFTWAITHDFILGKLLREIFLYSAVISETETPPEVAFNRFLETVDKGVQEPFFAWIHLLPPHDPYLPGKPFTGMFNSSERLRLFNKRMVEEVQAHKVENDEDWEIYRGRYDEFIKYCDNQFEDFLKKVEKRDELKNAIIIFTSDHGESFEHGYFTHNSNHHYEQVTHLPLIIKESGQTGKVIINDLTAQIDLPPTILGLADIPTPEWMEGRSLLPLMRGKKLQPKNIYSMSFQKNPSIGAKITKGTIAVWEGDYKLIYYLEEKKSLLFNLKEDPDELKNLFDEEKEISAHLFSLIQENLERVNKKVGQ